LLGCRLKFYLGGKLDASLIFPFLGLCNYETRHSSHS
jgi:hypothetical protein